MKIKVISDEKHAGLKYYWFFCPGCNKPHMISSTWSYNRNVDRPTFNPSIRVQDGETKTVCHSFIRDGRIQFLDDSHHSLAGHSVDLPDWVEPTFD